MARKETQPRFKTRDIIVPPVPSYDAAAVKALREKLEVSQKTLADILTINVSTIRKWEQGLKTPSGPSAKLLDILERKGIAGLQ